MNERRHRIAPKYTVFAVVSAVLVALDQITKFLVYNNVEYRREELEVIPGFLSIIHAQNPGAAMGLFSGHSTTFRMALFGVFTVIAVLVLLHMLWQLAPRDRLQSATLALIFSGAAGNAIDRIHKQTVTDFIKVYTDHEGLKQWLLGTFGTNEYPTFNVADSAIVVGVGLFLLYYLFLGDDESDSERDELVMESEVERRASRSTDSG